MARKYLRYFYQICLATYVLLLHLFSFIYDVTNVSQALINLDTNFFEVFFHEFLSVMVLTLLTTAAIHLPLKLWITHKLDHAEPDREEEIRQLTKLVAHPNIPRELLGEINMN